MKIKIHELAANEFDDAIDWYELQAKGPTIGMKLTLQSQNQKTIW